MQNIVIYKNNEVAHAYKGVYGYQITSSVIVIAVNELAAIIHPITPDSHIFIENIKEEDPQLNLPSNVIPLA